MTNNLNAMQQSLAQVVMFGLKVEHDTTTYTVPLKVKLGFWRSIIRKLKQLV